MLSSTPHCHLWRAQVLMGWSSYMLHHNLPLHAACSSRTLAFIRLVLFAIRYVVHAYLGLASPMIVPTFTPFERLCCGAFLLSSFMTSPICLTIPRFHAVLISLLFAPSMLRVMSLYGFRYKEPVPLRLVKYISMATQNGRN
jgi:hypothetical protein